MHQIVRYTAIRTPKNGLVPQGDGESIGTVPGDREDQSRILAEILFSMVFDSNGSLRSLPRKEVN